VVVAVQGCPGGLRESSELYSLLLETQSCYIIKKNNKVRRTWLQTTVLESSMVMPCWWFAGGAKQLTGATGTVECRDRSSDETGQSR
jgi:hypothetical protein